MERYLRGKCKYIVHWHGFGTSKDCWIHLLICAMLSSCLKHGKIRELNLGIVKNTREMFLEGIILGFEPERFAICITSDK